MHLVKEFKKNNYFTPTQKTELTDLLKQYDIMNTVDHGNYILYIFKTRDTKDAKKEEEKKRKRNKV